MIYWHFFRTTLGYFCGMYPNGTAPRYLYRLQFRHGSNIWHEVFLWHITFPSKGAYGHPLSWKVISSWVSEELCLYQATCMAVGRQPENYFARFYLARFRGPDSCHVYCWAQARIVLSYTLLPNRNALLHSGSLCASAQGLPCTGCYWKAEGGQQVTYCQGICPWSCICPNSSTSQICTKCHTNEPPPRCFHSFTHLLALSIFWVVHWVQDAVLDIA